ncbi:cyclase-like protein 3 [Primulina huaijiensis]|uniref:cyclase-like protein 3 n=1 Tax=Primulina huaijiensis TaxID=1492673 RepID=UPI003CC756E7
MPFSWPAVFFLLLLSSSDGAVYYNYRSIHDISSPIRAGQTTWGLSNGLKGTFLNETLKIVKMSTHMGTHVDSPAHAYQKMFKGHDVATLNIHTLNGPVLLVDVPGKKNITGVVLKSLKLPKGLKRVIFKTDNTRRGLMRRKEFELGYVGLEPDGANWLIEHTEIKLIGMDYLSVAASSKTVEVHKILLNKGDVIPLEGLDLKEIAAGKYALQCLPMKIPGADGAPTRCVLLE